MNAAPILEVSRLSKNFGGVRALNKVSFDLMPGELLILELGAPLEDRDPFSIGAKRSELLGHHATTGSRTDHQHVARQCL